MRNIKLTVKKFAPLAAKVVASKISTKLFAVSLTVSLLLSPTFSTQIQAQTASLTLGDLPLGSVIQIMGTDIGMCDGATAGNCATQNAPVLPYKFVKMQARGSDGTTREDTGFSPAGNYSYWMLMDNYCWWGSANCNYLGARSNNRQSFNHDNGSSAGSSPTNHHNNISLYLANNVLIRLDNFYNSLPASIGELDKAVAIPDYAWDMMPINGNGSSVSSWGSTYGTWTAKTYNPSGDTSNQFVFSGNNADPVMTSRIALPSYTEWQGGTFHYKQYPGRPVGVPTTSVPANTTGNGTFEGQIFSTYNAGSGSAFCLARWGTSNCAVLDGNTTQSQTAGYYAGVFNDEVSSITNLAYITDTGATQYSQPSSAANPRVRNPWLRSVFSGSNASVWIVSSLLSANSVNSYYAAHYIGVSPTLWLRSDIQITAGSGTYEIPYCLAASYCPGITTVEPVIIGAPTNGSVIGNNTNIVVSGSANGADLYNGNELDGVGLIHDSETTISADICNTGGQCVNKSTLVELNGRNDLEEWSLTWNSDELPAGTYQGSIVVYNSDGGVGETGLLHFVIAGGELPPTETIPGFNITDNNIVGMDHVNLVIMDCREILGACEASASVTGSLFPKDTASTYQVCFKIAGTAVNSCQSIGPTNYDYSFTISPADFNFTQDFYYGSTLTITDTLDNTQVFPLHQIYIIRRYIPPGNSVLTQNYIHYNAALN